MRQIVEAGCESDCREAALADARIMTLAHYSMTAFALLNGGRIVAYMPQIMCIYRDRNDAEAVSLLTWAMFTAANLATVSYSLTISSDLVVASIFALNAVCCFAITLSRRVPQGCGDEYGLAVTVSALERRRAHAMSPGGRLARALPCAPNDASSAA